MISQQKLDLANRVIAHYCELAKKHELRPSEYIIYNGLIYSCHQKTETMNFLHTVSISDIAQQTSVNRETVRRALTRLDECGLAQRVDDRWIIKLSK